jgi:hypothetical protein
VYIDADVARLRGVADVAAVLLDHHAVVYVRHVTNDNSGHRPGKLIGDLDLGALENAELRERRRCR